MRPSSFSTIFEAGKAPAKMIQFIRVNGEGGVAHQWRMDIEWRTCRRMQPRKREVIASSFSFVGMIGDDEGGRGGRRSGKVSRTRKSLGESFGLDSKEFRHFELYGRGERATVSMQ